MWVMTMNITMKLIAFLPSLFFNVFCLYWVVIYIVNGYYGYEILSALGVVFVYNFIFYKIFWLFLIRSRAIYFKKNRLYSGKSVVESTDVIDVSISFFFSKLNLRCGSVLIMFNILDSGESIQEICKLMNLKVKD